MATKKYTATPKPKKYTGTYKPEKKTLKPSERRRLA